MKIDTKFKETFKLEKECAKVNRHYFEWWLTVTHFIGLNSQPWYILYDCKHLIKNGLNQWSQTRTGQRAALSCWCATSFEKDL